MGAEGRTLKECGDVGRVGDLSHGVTLLLEGDINFSLFKNELISCGRGQVPRCKGTSGEEEALVRVGWSREVWEDFLERIPKLSPEGREEMHHTGDGVCTRAPKPSDEKLKLFGRLKFFYFKFTSLK